MQMRTVLTVLCLLVAVVTHSQAQRFGDSTTINLTVSNFSEASGLTAAEGTPSVLTVTAPFSDSLVKLSTSVPGGQQQADFNGTLVRYSLDLRPPFGPNTYIGGVTVKYTLDCGGSPHCYAAFGLRRNATCDESFNHTKGFSDYCLGQYSDPQEQANQTEFVLTWRNAPRLGVGQSQRPVGDTFRTEFSPDGHTVLDVVFGLVGDGAFNVASGWGLLIQSVEYETTQLRLTDAHNMVLPWSSHGHGSVAGSWLMFYEGNKITLSGRGYLHERWEDECCFDGVPGIKRCQPTYELDQHTTNFQYLGGGGGWIEGNYPPIGYINKFYRLDGVNGSDGTVTITQNQCGGQYNLAYSPTTFDSLVPSATNPAAGIYSLSPMAQFNWASQEVESRVRAGRPYACGASPHWDCSACMDGHGHSMTACVEPTYATHPEMNPTPMCQFNQSTGSN